MLFGSYDRDALSAVPGSNCWRQHLYQFDAAGKWVWPPSNGPIPATWPVPPSGTVGFYTLYPNADKLLSGQLDTQIRAFLKDAAPWSSLTAYAEADGGGEQFKAVGIDHAKMMQIHAHMHRLTVGTNVRYGPVLCGFGTTSVSYSPPGMDFYGIDIYDWGRDPILDMDRFLANCRVASGQPSPVLAVAETNTSKPAKRPEWFKQIFTWGKNYELRGGTMRTLLSYFNPGGTLSGPWLPADEKTINAMKAIAVLAPTT